MNDRRTFNVVLCVGLCRFVVVDHLHHHEEVVFAELLEAVGQSVHVDLS
jgi:hypothetical protein